MDYRRTRARPARWMALLYVQGQDRCWYPEDLQQDQISIKLQVTNNERYTSTILARPPMVIRPDTPSLATLVNRDSTNAYSAEAEDDIDYRIGRWGRGRG